MSERLGIGLGRLGLWLLAVLTLVPLYFLLSTSFRTGSDYASAPGGLPGELTLSNFDRLFALGDFTRWLANSVLLTGASTAVVLVAATMAAHALTYFELPGSSVATKAIASLMAMPPILLIVPLFVELARIDLIDTYLGAIVVYSAISLPFAIYMLTRFFRTMPRSVLEAARIDGAGPLRILPTVVVPLAKPALATLAVVTAFFVWNDLLIALVFLQSDEHRPLMAGLTTLASRETEGVPVVISGVMLSVLPIVALYLATQRLVIRGLYAGGSRGGT